MTGGVDPTAEVDPERADAARTDDDVLGGAHDVDLVAANRSTRDADRESATPPVLRGPRRGGAGTGE